MNTFGKLLLLYQMYANSYQGLQIITVGLCYSSRKHPRKLNRYFRHRRSQDFLWGAFFPQKVDDLFSRRPQYTG